VTLCLLVRTASAETLPDPTAGASWTSRWRASTRNTEQGRARDGLRRGRAAAGKLTPAFYGCYDWHSRARALAAGASDAAPSRRAVRARAREALAKSLTTEKIAIRRPYLGRKGREAFERPYGLAWLLALALELREWDDPQPGRGAPHWRLSSVPRRSHSGLASELVYPIREGEHNQTAFAFGLILDWARGTKTAACRT